MQNALSSYNNNSSSQNQNNKQASSSSSSVNMNKSISNSLKTANDKAKSAVKTNISDALAKYGAGH